MQRAKALPPREKLNHDITHTQIDNNQINDNSFSGDKLFLEELSFRAKEHNNGINDKTLIGVLKELYGDDVDLAKAVIVSDDDFNWFAKNALAIHARNELTATKTSNNLWYEESLPPDTMMYCLLSNRRKDTNTVAKMIKAIKKCNYLQAGGNETVGMGWFNMKISGEKNNNAND